MLAAPTAVIAGAMVFGMANGVIATSFAVSGQQFKVTSAQLDGDGFVQYGSVDHNADGVPVPVVIAGMKSATLADICQSVETGPVTLVLKAGGAAGPVTATDLVLDFTSLQGDAEFTNVEIGRDASTLTKGPNGVVGAKGMFGQQGDHIKVVGVKQNTWATTAGTFKLKGMSIALVPGSKPCF